jgi:DNA-binding MarR family transcriptional regulator
MAALMAADKAEFRFIRDSLELTDSALSQQLTTLERAGYVKVTKGQAGRRPRTWVSATPAGRAAFSGHLALLNQLASPAAAAGDGAPVGSEQVPGPA